MRYCTPVLHGLDDYLTSAPPDPEREAQQRNDELACERGRLADRIERFRVAAERLNAQADADLRFGLWFRARRGWKAWAHACRVIEDDERRIAEIDEEPT